MTLTLDLPLLSVKPPASKPAPQPQPKAQSTCPRYNWHILTLQKPYEEKEGTIVKHLNFKGLLRGLLPLKRRAASPTSQEIHFRILQPLNAEMSHAEGSFARSMAAFVLRQNLQRRMRQKRMQLKELPPAIIPIIQYDILIAQAQNGHRRENGFSHGFSHTIDWVQEDRLLDQARQNVTYEPPKRPIRWASRQTSQIAKRTQHAARFGL